MEVGDRPTLASKSAAYDRFGFAIETPGNTLEEKAEFLRKQAENNHDNLEDGAEHVNMIFFYWFFIQTFCEIAVNWVLLITISREKAEFLQKQTKNNHDSLEDGAEYVIIYIFSLTLLFKNLVDNQHITF